MACIVKNKTRGLKVLNFDNGNSVALSPEGSVDVNGPCDRATLLEGEEMSPEVQNALRGGYIVLEEIVPARDLRDEPARLLKRAKVIKEDV